MHCLTNHMGDRFHRWWGQPCPPVAFGYQNHLTHTQVAQSCPTLCDPMDCSPPGSSVHGIIQARILEWVAVYFSKECLNYRTIALISHTTKVMLKILQARLQQYVNRELSDVQAGFRKGRGTRDQIANIRWIIEKAREFHSDDKDY